MKAAKTSLLRNMASYTPVVMICALFQVASILVFTRVLGTDAFGRYALVIAFVQFMDALMFQWLRDGEMRFYEASVISGKQGTLFANSQAFLLWATILILFAGVPVALWITPDRTLALALCSGLVLLTVRSAAEQVAHRYRMQDNVVGFSLFEISRSFLCLALPVVLATQFGFEENAILLGSAGATFAVLLASLPWTAVRFSAVKVDRELMRSCWLFGSPGIMAGMLRELVNLSERYAISLFLGDAILGIYAAANGVARQSISLLFSVTLIANYPLLIKAGEREGKAAASLRLKENWAALLALCIPASVGVALTARHLAAVCLGEEFRSAGEIIPWIVLTVFITGMKVHAAGHIFHLEKRNDLLLKVTAPVMIATIFITFPLVWIWGIAGALAAALVSAVANLTVTLVVGSRLMEVPLPYDTLWRSLVSAAAMTAVLTSVRYPETLGGLTLMVASGASVYTTAALLVNLLGCRTMVINLIRPAIRQE